MKELCAVLALLVPAAAAAGQFSLTTGFDYTTGKYGNAVATDIVYIPITGKYATGKWTFKLTVPYISITGPDLVTLNGRFTPITQSTVRRTDSGLGDVLAAAGYNFYSGDALDLDAVGKVKFGTADFNKGLGTGKNDYSGELDAYYTMGRTMLFGTLGYRVYGSPVADVVLSNAPYDAVGITRRLNEKNKAGVMLSELKANSIYTGDQREVTVFYAHKAAPGRKIFLHATKGLTDSSPDFGFGATITGYF